MKNIKRPAVLFVLIVFTVAAILWLNSSNDKKDASKEEGVLKTKIPKDCEIPAQTLEQEFFPDGKTKSIFICAIGSGDQSKLFPRSPRLSFDEACRII
jgi:hypothetical protein